METDRILLEGMIFWGYHGTLAAERELGQQFVVDLELQCDLRAAGQTDDLRTTVDYSEVYQQTRTIVEGAPLQLTEAVAERVATAVLDRHLLVQAVRVKVRKPHVRLGNTVLHGSAIEIYRRRLP